MLWRAERLLRYGRSYSSAASRQHDPLNILFCGSDAFSSHSLRALCKLKTERPDKISTIDVVCRPDKRVGRGLKSINQVPIKAVANELQLQLHQIDTFTGWTPPTSINLVVAVSFGLLVPARILTAAIYGGLNVHPSMLPDLRGPAPIVHTLLKRRSHSGVTLQTMHPTNFDHGDILAQTPQPGILIRDDGTPEALLHDLAGHGAEMLRRGVEHGLFVPPVRSLDVSPDGDMMEYAPKITPEDRHIDWTTWTATEVMLRDRVLRNLWDMRSHIHPTSHPALYAGARDNHERVVFHGPWREVDNLSATDHLAINSAPGDVVKTDGSGAVSGFMTCDRRVIMPTSATIAGQRKQQGLKTIFA